MKKIKFSTFCGLIALVSVSLCAMDRSRERDDSDFSHACKRGREDDFSCPLYESFEKKPKVEKNMLMEEENSLHESGSLLHFAAASGSSEMIEFELMLLGDHEVNATDECGYTPLHYAAEEGQLDIVKFLLRKGAHLEAIDWVGCTPLCRSVECGQTLTVELLLKRGAQIKDHLLPTAASKGYLSIVTLLLDKGARLDSKNKYGNMALHEAAQNGHSKVLQYLLDRGAFCEALCNGGCTPLHRAAACGQTQVVRLLLAHGAQVDPLCNYDTPLHLATVRHHTDIIKLLLDAGADARAINRWGYSALDLAAQGHLDRTFHKLLIDQDAHTLTKSVWEALDLTFRHINTFMMLVSTLPYTFDSTYHKAKQRLQTVLLCARREPLKCLPKDILKKVLILCGDDAALILLKQLADSKDIEQTSFIAHPIIRMIAAKKLIAQHMSGTRKSTHEAVISPSAQLFSFFTPESVEKRFLPAILKRFDKRIQKRKGDSLSKVKDKELLRERKA